MSEENRSRRGNSLNSPISSGTFLANLRGGVSAAVGLFASDVGYGFIAYAALGILFANTGIVAAFMASIIGSLIPALIRGSGPLIGGPRPAQTLIFAAMISDIAAYGVGTDLSRIILGGMACVTVAGIFQTAFGLLGLGRIIRYAPVPVLAGFTNGVALSMVVSSASIIFNGQASSAESQWATDIFYRVGFGATLLFLMMQIHRLAPALHWSLIGLIIGTLGHLLLGQFISDLHLGEMLPAVTSLNPESGIAALNFDRPFNITLERDLLLIVAPAISLATINSLESLVLAYQHEIAHGIPYDNRRVLVGQGIANIVGGLLGALPSAPSNSRQLVARQMGGKDWSASIAFAFTMVAILLLTPLFVGAIPKLVVAVLLLYMAAHIVDPWAKSQILSWWRKESDADFQSHLSSNLSVMAVVMGTAIAFNLVAAMVVGVFLSMFLFVRHNSRSIISRIYFGNKRHSSVMRSLSHIELLKSHGEQIALVELDGPLFFGSGDLLKEEIEALPKNVRYIILDFRQIGTMDASGAGAVQRIAHRLVQRHARLALASLSPLSSQGRMIRESATHKALPDDHWFESADQALEAAEDMLIQASVIEESEAGNRMIHLDALRDLDDEQIAKLLDYTEENTYQYGELLFRRNDPGNTLYLLLNGQVEILVPVKGGPSRRLVALRSGTLFGEMAVLRGLPRSADAMVTSDNTEILSMTKAELARLHRDYPDIASTLMRNISIHLAARLASVTDELRYALATRQDESQLKMSTKSVLPA